MSRKDGEFGARDYARPELKLLGRREQIPWLPLNNVVSPPGSAVSPFTFTAIRM